MQFSKAHLKSYSSDLSRLDWKNFSLEIMLTREEPNTAKPIHAGI